MSLGAHRSWSLWCLQCGSASLNLVSMQEHLMSRHGVRQSDFRVMYRSAMTIGEIGRRWRAAVFNLGPLSTMTVLSVYRIGKTQSGFVGVPYAENPGKGKIPPGSRAGVRPREPKPPRTGFKVARMTAVRYGRHGYTLAVMPAIYSTNSEIIHRAERLPDALRWAIEQRPARVFVARPGERRVIKYWPPDDPSRVLWIAAVVRSGTSGLRSEPIAVKAETFTPSIERNAHLLAWSGPYATRAEAVRATDRLRRSMRL